MNDLQDAEITMVVQDYGPGSEALYEEASRCIYVRKSHHDRHTECVSGGALDELIIGRVKTSWKSERRERDREIEARRWKGQVS